MTPAETSSSTRRVSRRHPSPRAVIRRFSTARLSTARIIGDESGAATAEYAIATLAAVGLAGLLVVILKGDEVRSLLSGLIRGALSIGG